jgi:hypothetical protein
MWTAFFLIGLIFMLSLPVIGIPEYSAGWRELSFSHSNSSCLSVDQPTFRVNLTQMYYRLEIVKLEANATQVTLEIGQNLTRALLLTNVTGIENVSVVVDINSQDNWWFEINRQDQDVDFSIEYLEWQLVPPPQIDIIAIAISSPLPGIGILLAIMSGYRLVRVQLSCGRALQRSLGNGGRRKSSDAILVFILIGVLLIAPIIRGHRQGDFETVREVNMVLDQPRSFELNETSPLGMVNLTDLYATYDHILDVSVHSIDSEDVPFSLSVHDGENNTILGLHLSDSNTTWHLRIQPDEINSYLLDGERLNESCDVTFRLRVRTVTFSHIYDPIPYNLLAVAGAILCLFALLTARQIDRTLGQRNQN